MWIRKRTYDNLKKNLHNRGILLHEAILDSAELGEMVNEKDAEIAKLNGLLKKICWEIIGLKERLDKFNRKRGTNSRFVSNKSKNMEERKYYCRGACGSEVEKHGDRCPACQSRFNSACNDYRAMRKTIADKPYAEQRDAINRFRSGK